MGKRKREAADVKKTSGTSDEKKRKNAPSKVLTAGTRIDVKCMSCGEEKNICEDVDWKNVACRKCGQLGQFRFV